MKFVLYTDGSCHYADRCGGWAWLALPNKISGSDFAEDTTISRMELTAAIMGLAELGTRFGPSVVQVFSDSEYVVRGITDRSRKRKINRDLWHLLDAVTDTHTRVEYSHVRGHSGNEHNEEVDRLAGLARKSLLEKK